MFSLNDSITSLRGTQCCTVYLYYLSGSRGFVSSSKKAIESLWEELFRDPSHFYDVRNAKKSYKSPDFQHKRTGKGLWIDGFHNPAWVSVKLKSTELPGLEVNNARASIIELIKSSGKRKDISTLRRLRLDKSWITDDLSVTNTFIRSYAKCGALNEAREVFEQLPEPDVVSWNALIAGYAEHGFGEEALRCYRELERNRVEPNSVTYASTLKACGILCAVEIVEDIHAKVTEQGLLSKHIYLGTALVNAYAKCGALKKAQEAFDQLPERDVIAWNALIDGYAEQGCGVEALTCFREMENDGMTPNPVTYICSLRACTIVGAHATVEDIHAKVQEQGYLNKHIILANTLVNAYAKCGNVQKAWVVFDQLVERDVVSWNAIIAGYAEEGLGEEALACFRGMESEGVTADSITYTCILKSCAILGALKIIKQTHSQIREQGLLSIDVALATALVNAYAKCGTLKEAREVFYKLPERIVTSWNALITGYVDHGFGEEALICFREMKGDGVTPDSVTYVCVLKGCAMVGDYELVEEIHAQIRQQKLLNKESLLGTALINAYAKCGNLNKAEQIFDQLPERDVVCWSALIDGYVGQGFAEDALRCFREMRIDGVTPNLVTYVCILRACAIVGALDIIEAIHAQVSEQGILNKYIVLGTTLVNSYAKCGAMKEALEVFEQLAERDVVSWNALIAGYADQRCGEEALACFWEMESDGITPDSVTYCCILKACAVVGAVETVEDIYSQLKEQGLLENDTALESALVNAYAKCGAAIEAHQVFNGLVERDIESWNSLLAGYAQLGLINELRNLFNRMVAESIFPDPVTFLALLNGCSHGGLLEDGERLFHVIGSCGVGYTPEHYTCMVDLFGRAGQFKEAKYFVIDHASTLLAFLGACRKWVNVDLGIWAYEKLLQLDQNCAGAYVSMGNIYAAAGMTKQTDGIRMQFVDC